MKLPNPSMGLTRGKSVGKTVIIILLVIITVSGGYILFLWNWDPPHYGSSSLRSINFYPRPNPFEIREDNDPLINDSLKDRFNESEITLEIEVIETQTTFVLTYGYLTRDGRDMLIITNSSRDEKFFMFEEWERETTYTFTIRFLCQSDNETVRSFELFDDDRYVQGRFRVEREGNRDIISYFDIDGTHLMKNGKPVMIYMGNYVDNGIAGTDYFIVEIDEFISELVS